MKSADNHGVIIAGNGVLNAKQLAVGAHARIDSIVNASGATPASTIEDLRRQLDELLGVLRENSHCLPPEAGKAIQAVKEEVAKPEPNKLVVTSVLDSVSDVLKSFGSLTGAIVAIRQLASLVL